VATAVPRMPAGSGVADVLGGGSGRGRRFCGQASLPRQAFTLPTPSVTVDLKVNKCY
jgi:hypothetical protein